MFGLKIHRDGLIRMENERIHVIGKIFWIEDKVFYCSKCNKRYDFAILYNQYPNQPSCKICNNDMEIKEASVRIGIPHPKQGGW